MDPWFLHTESNIQRRQLLIWFCLIPFHLRVYRWNQFCSWKSTNLSQLINEVSRDHFGECLVTDSYRRTHLIQGPHLWKGGAFEVCHFGFHFLMMGFLLIYFCGILRVKRKLISCSATAIRWLIFPSTDSCFEPYLSIFWTKFFFSTKEGWWKWPWVCFKRF